MKRKIIWSVLLLLAVSWLAAPAYSASWKDKLKDAVQSQTSSQQSQKSSPSTQGLADSDMVDGLKAALAKASKESIAKLGKTDGFWHNPQVRIPLPAGLDKLGGVARKLGQEKQVEAFQLSLNRAAEKAVPEVADIFSHAIKQMNIKDAKQILTGGDHAATDYFKRSSSDELAQRIQPIVTRQTDKVDITHQYKSLESSLMKGGAGGLLSKLGGNKNKADALDLDAYVTQKTIDGLFAMMADEEQAIRQNPAQRTSAILRKVFSK